MSSVTSTSCSLEHNRRQTLSRSNVAGDGSRAKNRRRYFIQCSRRFGKSSAISIRAINLPPGLTPFPTQTIAARGERISRYLSQLPQFSISSNRSVDKGNRDRCRVGADKRSLSAIGLALTFHVYLPIIGDDVGGVAASLGRREPRARAYKALPADQRSPIQIFLST